MHANDDGNSDALDLPSTEDSEVGGTGRVNSVWLQARVTALTEDLDQLGHKIRQTEELIRALHKRQNRLEQYTKTGLDDLKLLLNSFISASQSQQTRMEEQLKENLRLLQQVAGELATHTVVETDRWQRLMKIWSGIALGVVMILVLFKKDVGDWLVRLGAWWGA